MNFKQWVKSCAGSLFYQRRYNHLRRRAQAVPNRKPCILFTSVSRAEIGGNALYVYRRLCERGFEQTHDIVLDYAPNIASVRNVASQLAFIEKLARADYIFCDDYHPYLYLLEYPADVKVIQLWHAVGAFKTVGFSRNRKDAQGFQRTSIAHRSYTHVIVNAECDRAHYADAFGLPVERIYATGLPRVDEFMKPEHLRRGAEAFAQRFPQAAGKRVVLFAPTFRGEDIREASYDFTRLDLPRLAQWCRERGALFVLKLHPFVQSQLEVPAELRDVIVDASDVREVNDILPAADLVVTDYSSVIYETSLLGTPMVFFAYDLDEYEASRGFYEPYRTFVPGPIVQDMDGLIAALDAEPDTEAALRFKRAHFDYEGTGQGSAADRIIDLVL